MAWRLGVARDFGAFLTPKQPSSREVQRLRFLPRALEGFRPSLDS